MMLQVSRRTRRTDRHRLKELLKIWKERRPHTYNVPSLIAILDSQVVATTIILMRILISSTNHLDVIDSCIVLDFVTIRYMWMVCSWGWQWGRAKYGRVSSDVRPTKETHLLSLVLSSDILTNLLLVVQQRNTLDKSLKLTTLLRQSEKMVMRINLALWLSKWLLSRGSLCRFSHPSRLSAFSHPEGLHSALYLRPKPA